jgi:hypothetical protein
MVRQGVAALAWMLGMGLVAPAQASDVLTRVPAAFDLAALQPFMPLGDEAILTPDELKALTKTDRLRIEPASATEPASPAAAFIDSFKYNLEKEDVSQFDAFNRNVFWEQSKAVKWDIIGVYGLTTAFGISNWDWGSSGFHFENEGWFGKDTKYGGMDKLGHAFTGYLLTEYFSQRIAHEVADTNGAIVTGSILGMGVMTYIEFFDGFSGGHGFSYEDLIANGLGVGFSFLRNTVPEVANKLDFRLEYMQSQYSGFAPFTDYAGQKYVLALKLAGFDELKETPLRFVELQAGYFTQGYTDAEREAGVEQKREPYLAVGLNLNELLGQAPEVRDTLPGLAASRAFEYLQVPYTYIPTATR